MDNHKTTNYCDYCILYFSTTKHRFQFYQISLRCHMIWSMILTWGLRSCFVYHSGRWNGNYESAWTIRRGSAILLGISLSFKAAFYVFHRAQNTSHMVLNDLKITYSKDTGLPISTLNGTQIERVSSYKYLGIWLDENLALMST